MSTLSPLTGSPASVAPSAESAPAPVTAPVTTKSKTNPKPRKRVNTAEKRSQHNAIERARRETLNGKFLTLAKLLPSLAASRRPSKSAIVNGSIAHLTLQRNQRLLASKLLKQLCAERDELLTEVNEWRNMSGCTVKDSRSAWTEEMEEISNVEKEVFGSFASMGGDGDDDDDGSNDFDQASTTNSFTAGNGSVNGLITPRSSTDLDLSLPNLGSGFAGQGMQTATDAQSQSSSATINSINWSADFAFGLPSQVNNAATIGALSYNNGFMSEHSHSSPVASNQGNAMTPALSESQVYTHTPSPASSHGQSVHEVEQAQPKHGSVPVPPQWTPQQFAMLQQQVQQAQAVGYHRARLASAQQQAQHQAFNPLTGSSGNNFDAIFGQQQQQQQQQTSQQSVNPMMQTDMLTQSLMASMFPQGKYMASGTAQPVQGQPSLADLQKAVRAGMGLGLGMMGAAWPQALGSPVEGF